MLQEALGCKPGAAADIEHTVALVDGEPRECFVAHLLVPDEGVDRIVHLREIFVEQAGSGLVLEDSHCRLAIGVAEQ